MGYDIAITRAWENLEKFRLRKKQTIRFLADEYEIDPANKRILSLSCNVEAKAYTSILLLHYLLKKTEGLPEITEEWISFAQLAGGPGYSPTFKKRVIDRLVRKYGDRPETILETTARFKAKRVQLADISVGIEVLEKVPVLITLWRKDEEFAPEANVHFDKNISQIFCTEDIVVISEFIAARI